MKKIITIFVCFCFLAATAIPAAATDYRDLEGYEDLNERSQRLFAELEPCLEDITDLLDFTSEAAEKLEGRENAEGLQIVLVFYAALVAATGLQVIMTMGVLLEANGIDSGQEEIKLQMEVFRSQGIDPIDYVEEATPELIGLVEELKAAKVEIEAQLNEDDDQLRKGVE